MKLEIRRPENLLPLLDSWTIVGSSRHTIVPDRPASQKSFGLMAEGAGTVRLSISWRDSTGTIIRQDRVDLFSGNQVGDRRADFQVFRTSPQNSRSAIVELSTEGTVELLEAFLVEGNVYERFPRNTPLNKLTVEYEAGDQAEGCLFPQNLSADLFLDMEEGYIVLQRGRRTVDYGYDEKTVEEIEPTAYEITYSGASGNGLITAQPSDNPTVYRFTEDAVSGWRTSDLVPAAISFDIRWPANTEFESYDESLLKFNFGILTNSLGEIAQRYQIYIDPTGEFGPILKLLRLTTGGTEEQYSITLPPVDLHRVWFYIEMKSRTITIYLKFSASESYRPWLSVVVDYDIRTGHHGWEYTPASSPHYMLATPITVVPLDSLGVKSSPVDPYNPYYDVELYRSSVIDGLEKKNHRAAVPHAVVNTTNSLVQRNGHIDAKDSPNRPRLIEQEIGPTRLVEVVSSSKSVVAGEDPYLLRVRVTDQFGCPAPGEKVVLSVAGGGFLSSPFDRSVSASSLVVETGNDGCSVIYYTPPATSRIVVAASADEDEVEFLNTAIYQENLTLFPTGQVPLFRSICPGRMTYWTLKALSNGATVASTGDPETDVPGKYDWDIFWASNTMSSATTTDADVVADGRYIRVRKTELLDDATSEIGKIRVTSDGTAVSPTGDVRLLSSADNTYAETGDSLLLSAESEDLSIEVTLNAFSHLSETTIKCQVPPAAQYLMFDASRLIRITATHELGTMSSLELDLVRSERADYYGAQPVRNLVVSVVPPPGLSSSIGDGSVLLVEFDVPASLTGVSYYQFYFEANGPTGAANSYSPLSSGPDQLLTEQKTRRRVAVTGWASGTTVSHTADTHRKVALLWPDDVGDDFTGTASHLSTSANAEYATASLAYVAGERNQMKGLIDASSVLVTVSTMNVSAAVLGKAYGYARVKNLTPQAGPTLLGLPVEVLSLEVSSKDNAGVGRAISSPVSLEKGEYMLEVVSGCGMQADKYVSGVIAELVELDGTRTRFNIGDLGSRYFGHSYTSYELAELDGRSLRFQTDKKDVQLLLYFPDSAERPDSDPETREAVLGFTYGSLGSGSNFTLTLNGGDETANFSFNSATPANRKIASSSEETQALTIAKRVFDYFAGRVIAKVDTSLSPHTKVIFTSANGITALALTVDGAGVSVVSSNTQVEERKAPEVVVRLSVVSTSTTGGSVLSWYDPSRLLPGGQSSFSG